MRPVGPTTLLAACVAILAAPLARAQAAPPGLEGVPPDTLLLTIGLRFPEKLSLADDLRQEFLYTADALAGEFQPPQPWDLPLWPRTHDPDTVLVGTEGFFAFHVSASGKFKSARFTGAKGAPGLREALLAALQRLENTGGLASPVPGQDTTVVLEVVAAIRPEPGLIPLGRVRAISWKVDRHPRAEEVLEIKVPWKRGRTPGNGGVLLQFVVSEKGKVERETVEVLASDDETFSKAVIDAVMKASYSPALVQGVPVRMLVRVSFGYVTEIGW